MRLRYKLFIFAAIFLVSFLVSVLIGNNTDPATGVLAFFVVFVLSCISFSVLRDVLKKIKRGDFE